MGHRLTNVFSIGHSNHPTDRFLQLLQEHAIELLVDVRSQPYSRYASQHNREPLERSLSAAGVRYLYLGSELGGRPEGPEFYDSEGHVLYARLAASNRFIAGIERLEQAAAQLRTAVMCAEENPASCHRTLLIGRVLAARGIELRHIRGDGRIETEADLESAGPAQISLFVDRRDATWRSTRPVSRPGKPAAS